MSNFHIHSLQYHRHGKISWAKCSQFEVFAEIFSRCLDQKCLLLKRGAYIHGKTFTAVSNTAKTMKVQPSESFRINGIPYLSILKPGSYTRRGSNICRIVQQNERNKCLGPFKCRVSKLLNLINLKMVPNDKENQFILDISLNVCISLLNVATVDRLQCIYHVCHLPALGCTYEFYYISQ